MPDGADVRPRRVSRARRGVAILTVGAVIAAAGVISGAVATTADGLSLRRLTNNTRLSYGRRALRLNERLSSVAQAHARKMADSNRLYHNAALARQLRSFNWTVLGENVGVGTTIPGLHRAFMNSTAHRRNVLRRGFRRVGVGTVTSNDRLWVVVVFSD